MMEPCCHRFTSAEGGARLAAAATAANTLVTECGDFVATRLTHEEAYNIRGLLSSGRQRSVRISRAANVKPDAYELGILTDLKVTHAVKYDDVMDWSEELETKEVVVCTSEVFSKILQRGILRMCQINILVIDSCHTIYKDENLQYIMKVYKQSKEDKRPRILAITYPLFNSPKSEDASENTDKLDLDTENALVLPAQTLIELGVQENLDDFDMYEKLEYKIDQLEEELCCKMDLAEDIDGCKRISGPTIKPKELLIEYDSKTADVDLPKGYIELENYMRECVNKVMEFLEDHRHDPTEIYGEELYDELKNIPDPTIEPRLVVKEFLYILEQLGPYAADKAAFSLLVKLEKLKIKVPYERHFLLLRLCTTMFVKIRCYTECILSEYNEWDRIRLFSTPKLMRLVEILEQFTPPDLKTSIENGTYVKFERRNDYDGNFDKNNTKFQDLDEKIEELNVKNCVDDVKGTNEVSVDAIIINNGENDKKSNDIDKVNDKDVINDKDKVKTYVNDCNNDAKISINDISKPTDKMLSDIDNCNFTALGDKIEDRLNIIQGNLRDLDINEVCEEKKDQKDYILKTQARIDKPLFTRRSGRSRARRPPRNNSRLLQAQHNPDALCGVVFVKEPLMAKILFLCLVDISRARPAVSYINSQYCAVEPTVGHKECQKQGRRHEEVLKKFRMHECNLLLTTSALEEGIDLPRCNLILRWDVPPSYRSYVLCRSRSRAPRSAAVVLGDYDHNEEMLHCLATYKELDQIITRKCGCGIQDEPSSDEESHADTFNTIIRPYTPDKTTCVCIKNRIKNDIANSMKRTISDSENEIFDDNDFGKTCVERKDFEKNGVRSGKSDGDCGGFEKSGVECKKSDEKSGVECKKSDVDHVDSEKSGVGSKKSEGSNHGGLENSRVESKKSDGDHVDSEKSGVKSKKSDSNDVDKTCDINLSKDSENSGVESKYIEDSGFESKNIEDSGVESKYIEDSGVKSKNIEESGVESKKSDVDGEKCTCISDESVASVDLNSAIALINRYCAKLPSDTFTRLAPQWWIERVRIPDEVQDAYICTLRLPLNCPVKYNIVGHPMPTRVLARRMVALQACRILHKSGELDNQLMPIGKENFKAMELENSHPVQDSILSENDSARPGTTKRRQYYYKRTAWVFTDCQPVVDTSDSELQDKLDVPNDNVINEAKNFDNDKTEDNVKYTGKRRNMLYAIESSLWCALPERYNTRGRRLHAPQHATQALAILMARDEPTNLQIPAFPVYTRSGEVRVSVEHVPDADVRMSPRRGRLVRRFMHFVFTEVLRVRRRGMTLESDCSTRNNYYIVPTVKTIKEDGTQKIDIDWAFLEQIYHHTEQQKLIDAPRYSHQSEGENSAPLKNPLLKDGEIFEFDADLYKEAVVTPWYRNQDQPQFFLVAEICSHLTPDSAFPSATHDTFRSYYRAKYKVVLTQPKQPLLDVDHTSARLNLLTPRYVNRKGVALPVSSERTRRAKRDRLDQKQILVPELCTVHPFAAPLWFATVALPCVLYRINALLIADEIRRAVAIDVGLGVPRIDDTTMPGFQWPPLDFGWCLAEVLSADAERTDKKKDDDTDKEETLTEIRTEETGEEAVNEGEDVKEKTINEILQEEHEKLNQDDNESGFEIGTWSNEMASSIPDDVDDIYDEWSEPLPPNLTFCTSANGGVNWCDPVKKPKPEYNAQRAYTMADSDCSFMSSDFDSDDSEFDMDTDTDAESGFGSSKGVNASLGVRIEYKTAHEAEAVDLEPPKKTHPAPQRDPRDEKVDRVELVELLKSGEADEKYIEKFRNAVQNHKQTIVNIGLVTRDKKLIDLLPQIKENTEFKMAATETKLKELFPYENNFQINNGQISLECIEKNKRLLLEKLKNSLNEAEINNLNCFYMKDINIDDPNYVNEKIANVGFDSKEKYIEKVLNYEKKEYKPYYQDSKGKFDFDYQPDLDGHPGPSPSVILQALTMSNANDGINLERLETIGDSFLKFAITAYLYCAHPTVHEGKLSHMRSKQVSNLNLYRLGRSARLGARMIASKFEPHDNWLPPCHRAPPSPRHQHEGKTQESHSDTKKVPPESTGCYIPYNLITQHSIPDKSIADCVEALIGAYLLECGPRGALLFMAWLGISVLPHHRIALPRPAAKDDTRKTPVSQSRQRNMSSSSTSTGSDENNEGFDADVPEGLPWGSGNGPAGARRPYKDEHGNWYQIMYGELKAPPSPLLRYIQDPEGELERMLSGYDALENTLQYRFKDRSLLLQALTHASHQQNTLTDCYQRLEFLGDAILDYLITRHLYEDGRRHSPGALTDLRSALVNNTIFATLAVRHGFHKYFRHMSPGLNEVLMKYVKIQEENGHSISEEHYLIQEDELEQAEDVEVPKALGDLFESIAGAIFLDSGMSLGAVWGSYVRLMGAELEAFSAAAPKSPVRELLEAEPDTAKFSKPERLADGRRVRVCVEVFGRGTFKGVGRNYRIAKGTAARCALRHLRIHRR